MKASDIFGVAVRTIGLLVLLYGLYDIWSGFDNFFENLLSPPSQDSDSTTASTLTYFVFGIPEFILGTLLFFLANWLVKLAYRD
ncbi:MAG: hypothetical protein ACLQSR_03140 [Limisphaerales bacterium]